MPFCTGLSITYIRKVWPRTFRAGQRSRIAPGIHPFHTGVVGCNAWPAAPSAVHVHIAYLLCMACNAAVCNEELFSSPRIFTEWHSPRQRGVVLLIVDGRDDSDHQSERPEQGERGCEQFGRVVKEFHYCNQLPFGFEYGLPLRF